MFVCLPMFVSKIIPSTAEQWWANLKSNLFLKSQITHSR